MAFKTTAISTAIVLTLLAPKPRGDDEVPAGKPHVLRSGDLTGSVSVAATTQPEPDSYQPPQKPGRPATAPSTNPASTDVSTLIRQLGDDDPKLRNAATEALKKVGKPALPDLQTAAKSDDPEVRTRAEAIIASIEGRDRPAAASPANEDPNLRRFGQLGLVRIAPGGALRIEAGVQMRVSVQNNNGAIVRDVNINEHGRQIHMHESADGINLEVTEKGESKTYQARNAAELKEKEPEAFKDYEKCNLAGGGNGAGGIRVEAKP